MLLSALTLACALSSAHAAGPRIAVFSAPHFPYYMADPRLSPELVTSWLQDCGLDAQLTSATALADPAAFDARSHALLIHLYGNTYPLPAFENLRRYHAAGGSLLLVGGTPFCHPCIPGGARGWILGSPPDTVPVRDTRVLHSGEASIAMHGRQGPWFGPRTAPFPVTPGEVYTVGAWARTSADLLPDERSTLFLRAFAASGTFLGQGGPTIPAPGTDWTWIEGRFTVPPEAATLDLSVQMWCTGGTLWLDDMVLTRGPACNPAANLLTNPGFEETAEVPTWEDLGHRDDFTHQGMGTGGFVWLPPADDFRLASGDDPAGLGCLPWAKRHPGGELCLPEPTTLPAGDRFQGLVAAVRGGQDVGYPVGLIEHHCPECPGAVDLLCGSNTLPALTESELRHLVVRCALLALERSGRLTPAQRVAALDRLNAACPPEDLGRPPALVQGRLLDAPLFPRSPAPAPTLMVMDLHGASRPAQFAAAVLQGLVNRTQPRLYALSGVFAAEDDPTAFWLENLRRRGYTTAPAPDLPGLVTRFADDHQGAVLYPADWWTDPARTGFINPLTMLCATSDLIPVTQELNETLRLPVRFDAREAWPTVRDAYRWVLDNLWDQLSHDALAFHHPGFIPLVDYLVAHRILPIAVCQDAPGETRDLFEEALRRTPPHIPVMGCWGRYGENPPLAWTEGELVELTSRWAKPFVVSEWAANLSVHSGVPVAPQELRRRPAPPLAYDPSKVYLCFDVSDGDNLQYIYSSFYCPRWWGHPQRGQVNLTWSIGPGAVDLMPDIMAYYYQTATPADGIICAVSGAGYCYPEIYGARYEELAPELLDQFVVRTRTLMARADMQVLNPFRGGRAEWERYARGIPELAAILADYGKGAPLTAAQANYTVDEGRVPVFRNRVCFGGEGDVVAGTVREITAATEAARPDFLHVFVINWWNTPGDIAAIMQQLGPDYVACTPDQFVEMWRQSQATAAH